ESSQAEQQQEGEPSKLKIAVVSPLGRDVDFTDLLVPLPQQMSFAGAIPPAGQQPAATASVTQLRELYGFSTAPAGGLVQFDASFGAGSGTYTIGTAALVDQGTNAASGLQWGRWSGGAASVGGQAINLANTSLHYILGQTFELVPVLPVTGTLNFTF